MRIPSSIPFGWGWISLVSGGSCSVPREEYYAVFFGGCEGWIDAGWGDGGQLFGGCGGRVLGCTCQRQFFLLIGTDSRGRNEGDAGVRIGDGAEFEEFIDAAAAFLVSALQFDADAGAGDVIFRIQKRHRRRAGA